VENYLEEMYFEIYYIIRQKVVFIK
jgi:hypothetical protein